MGLITEVRNEVYEETTFEIQFDVKDSISGLDVTPSSLKVFVYLDEDPSDGSPTYINGRDGTDATGLSNSGNTVTMHLSPADNQIQNAESPYESHRVAIQVFYNGDVDRDVFEWILKIRNAPYTT